MEPSIINCFSLCQIQAKSSSTVSKDNCAEVPECYVWLLQIARTDMKRNVKIIRNQNEQL